MRSQASGDRQSGSVKLPAKARRKVSYGSLETALNGGSPVSISNTRTPRPHQSDAQPVPLRWITSGACKGHATRRLATAHANMCIWSEAPTELTIVCTLRNLRTHME